jgi:hypothetical protein
MERLINWKEARAAHEILPGKIKLEKEDLPLTFKLPTRLPKAGQVKVKIEPEPRFGTGIQETSDGLTQFARGVTPFNHKIELEIGSQKIKISAGALLGLSLEYMKYIPTDEQGKAHYALKQGSEEGKVALDQILKGKFDSNSDMHGFLRKELSHLTEEQKEALKELVIEAMIPVPQTLELVKASTTRGFDKNYDPITKTTPGFSLRIPGILHKLDLPSLFSPATKATAKKTKR